MNKMEFTENDKRLVEEGLSEDGKEFTKFVITPDNEEISKDTGVTGLPDASTIPEEHRDQYVKMVADYHAKQAELDSLKKRAEFSEAIAREAVGRARPDTVKEGSEGPQVEKIVEKLKFEEGDYYAPFFKALAGAIDSLNENIAKERVVEQQQRATTWQQQAYKFIVDNNIDPKVVSKMDAIAKEFGNQLYQDLPRLKKWAEAELGTSTTTSARTSTTNTPANSRKTIEAGSFRKAVAQSKPVKTMQDAFEAAEEQLRQK